MDSVRPGFAGSNGSAEDGESGGFCPYVSSHQLHLPSPYPTTRLTRVDQLS